MAPALAKVGGTLLQAEDETGVGEHGHRRGLRRRAVADRDRRPRLALMTEAIGLAVASEVPIVVVDVMRGGPSTGIPAKSEQSDLSFAVSGLHGDAPRLVLAPTSIADCVATTQWAVHLPRRCRRRRSCCRTSSWASRARSSTGRPTAGRWRSALTVAANAPDYKTLPRHAIRRLADGDSRERPA